MKEIVRYCLVTPAGKIHAASRYERQVWACRVRGDRIYRVNWKGSRPKATLLFGRPDLPPPRITFARARLAFGVVPER